MWKKELYSLQTLGIEEAFPLEAIPSLPIDTLPSYDEKHHRLQRKDGVPIASFTKEKALAHGSYGNLYLTVRDGQPVLLKQPRLPEMNLFQEGVLQCIAQRVAETNKMGWCIPKVYDIFWRQEKVWFSMDYVPGEGVLDWFAASTSPDRDFYLLLAQVSLILLCLESQLGLDHRDLKVDNLLIKRQPCELQVSWKETTWTLQSPFTVVILDFGFACLGSKDLRGKPIVNLGDGILPPMDPCPKEGRDLFQLLTSFLRFPSFTQKISPSTLKRIDDWLSVGTKSYGTMARRWSTENWTYLVASQRDFAIPSCCPLTLLKNLLAELPLNLRKQ